MTIPEIVLGVVAAATAIYVAVSKSFADSRLEGVRAEHAQALARFEHRLAALGKQTQARLDHAVTVSRVQFDHEFKLLREIWNCVAKARAAVSGAVDILIPDDDTAEKKLQRFLKTGDTVAEAQRRLVLAIDNNSPFYPEPIFQAVNAFRIRMKTELSQLQTNPTPFKGEWFEARAAARAEIVALADGVSAAIRDRLGAIVIQGGPAGPFPDATDPEAEAVPASKD